MRISANFFYWLALYLDLIFIEFGAMLFYCYPV